MITQIELFSELSYNPITGIFTSLKRYGKSPRKIGSIVGTLKPNGYIEIYLLGKLYQAHRLAWLYMYGEMPDKLIDHINNIKHDNGILNLRQVTFSENAQNLITAKITNKTGLLGVRKKTNKNSYEASIKINGKNIYIGSFPTAELAHEAYILAKRQHHSHGTL